MHSSSLLILVVLLVLASVSDFAYASPTPKTLEERWKRPWKNQTGSEVFDKQMKNPSEVFTVMLIIGGDVVQKAIAKACGRRFVLISFSFGWVAYSFTSLMSAFGDGGLMPEPDFDADVITISSKDKRENKSWVLSRLIRDLEHHMSQGFNKWYEKRGAPVDKDDDALTTQISGNKGVHYCQKATNASSGLVVTFASVSASHSSRPSGYTFDALQIFVRLTEDSLLQELIGQRSLLRTHHFLSKIRSFTVLLSFVSIGSPQYQYFMMGIGPSCCSPVSGVRLPCAMPRYMNGIEKNTKLDLIPKRHMPSREEMDIHIFLLSNQLSLEETILVLT